MAVISTGRGTLETLRQDFATGRWTPGTYSWFTQVDLRLSPAQPEPPLPGVSGGTHSQTFTGVSSVLIPGTAHDFGHKFLHVQVYDSAGNLIGPNTLHIHPTTFDITLTFATLMSGYVVVKN